MERVKTKERWKVERERERGGGGRTNERFIELGRLPMSNREVGGGGTFFCA